jgi:hypothetical protein
MGQKEYATDDPVVRGILECECDGRLMTIDLSECFANRPRFTAGVLFLPTAIR